MPDFDAPLPAWLSGEHIAPRVPRSTVVRDLTPPLPSHLLAEQALNPPPPPPPLDPASYDIAGNTARLANEAVRGRDAEPVEAWRRRIAVERAAAGSARSIVER